MNKIRFSILILNQSENERDEIAFQMLSFLYSTSDKKKHLRFISINDLNLISSNAFTNKTEKKTRKKE